MKTPSGPVVVISNPTSGHNRDQFDLVSARITGCHVIEHIVTHSAADIAPALQTLSQQNIAVLAINGGDGTASSVLGAMLESGKFASPPLIALLPGGTANMNAGDIGIKGPLKKAVARFCHWCEGDRNTSGRLASRSLLRVTTGADDTAHYGMFLGGGAVIQGTEYAHKEIHSRGLRNDFSLALGTLRTVWGVLRDDPAFNRHVTMQLSLDGDDAARYDTLILAISTLQRLAFGMRPFWGEGPGDIRITLMEQGCSSFARTFLSIVRGHPNRNAVPSSGYRSHNAQQVEIHLDGKLNLDGEILQTDGAVHISASRPLEFLQL